MKYCVFGHYGNSEINEASCAESERNSWYAYHSIIAAVIKSTKLNDSYFEWPPRREKFARAHQMSSIIEHALNGGNLEKATN